MKNMKMDINLVQTNMQTTQQKESANMIAIYTIGYYDLPVY